MSANLGDQLRANDPCSPSRASMWVDAVIKAAAEESRKKLRSVSAVVESAHEPYLGGFEQFKRDFAPLAEAAVDLLKKKGGIHNAHYEFTCAPAHRALGPGGFYYDHAAWFGVKICFDW